MGQKCFAGCGCHKHKDFRCAGSELLCVWEAHRETVHVRLLGRTPRGLQVAPHVSGAGGRFINEKLTERPHFTIDDKVESLPRTVGFMVRQAFLIHIWHQG